MGTRLRQATAFCYKTHVPSPSSCCTSSGCGNVALALGKGCLSHKEGISSSPANLRSYFVTASDVAEVDTIAKEAGTVEV